MKSSRANKKLQDHLPLNLKLLEPSFREGPRVNSPVGSLNLASLPFSKGSKAANYMMELRSSLSAKQRNGESTEKKRSLERFGRVEGNDKQGKELISPLEVAPLKMYEEWLRKVTRSSIIKKNKSIEPPTKASSNSTQRFLSEKSLSPGGHIQPASTKSKAKGLSRQSTATFALKTPLSGPSTKRKSVSKLNSGTTKKAEVKKVEDKKVEDTKSKGMVKINALQSKDKEIAKLINDKEDLYREISRLSEEVGNLRYGKQQSVREEVSTKGHSRGTQASWARIGSSDTRSESISNYLRVQSSKYTGEADNSKEMMNMVVHSARVSPRHPHDHHQKKVSCVDLSGQVSSPEGRTTEQPPLNMADSLSALGSRVRRLLERYRDMNIHNLALNEQLINDFNQLIAQRAGNHN